MAPDDVACAIVAVPSAKALAPVWTNARAMLAAVRRAHRTVALPPRPTFRAIAPLISHVPLAVVALAIASSAEESRLAPTEVGIKATTVDARACANRLITRPALPTLLASAVSRPQALAVLTTLVTYGPLARRAAITRHALALLRLAVASHVSHAERRGRVGIARCAPELPTRKAVAIARGIPTVAPETDQQQSPCPQHEDRAVAMPPRGAEDPRQIRLSHLFSHRTRRPAVVAADPRRPYCSDSLAQTSQVCVSLQDGTAAVGCGGDGPAAGRITARRWVLPRPLGTRRSIRAVPEINARKR